MSGAPRRWSQQPLRASRALASDLSSRRLHLGWRCRWLWLSFFVAQEVDQHMSELPFSVAEALRLIRDPELTHDRNKAMAAGILMECARDVQITIADMLRCLDYGGYIAEAGARFLYIRTGRDDSPFIVDRRDWEAYLHENFPTQKG
jgi:hypothetical protein